ncbi:AraC family transcriptional regulator [Paenibacillus sp. IB182496]|uniref:AraC family transcriptional regulator n=1 Tax=Paenibacillus sabuli TaxID=2772509 RepID=A0A927BTJ8_9BACL|nr:helix-turn-helix domain-containing protein [Paenibacillus sabuli]MBD2846538.1 AraC family transcriptional regulator [Paenibacillus sabuli]
MTETKEKTRTEHYAALDTLVFKLQAAERIEPSGDAWALRAQFLPAHLLLYADSCEGWLTVDGQFFELRAGAAHLAAPGQLIEGQGTAREGGGLYALRFEALQSGQPEDGQLRTLRPGSPLPVYGALPVRSPVSVGLLCGGMCEQCRAPQALQRFEAQVRFLELLHSLLLDHSRDAAHRDDAALEQARLHLEQHYGERLTIRELAAVARMSTRHFIRRFKQAYGCSALDYLTVYRIRQAQTLLRAGSRRMSDIARHVGYPDEIYFRRKFKQVTGVPPAAFRHNSRQKIAAVDDPAIGILLALQIIPSAAPSNHPWTDYYRRKYDPSDVLALSEDAAMAYEQLQRLEPDAIVAACGRPDDRLCDIAPIVTSVRPAGDWRAQLRQIARELDRSAIAELWLARYTEKAAHVRARIATTVGEDKLLIVRLCGTRLELPGNRSMAEVFYTDLQLHAPPTLSQDAAAAELSCERLAELEADRLLVFVGTDAASQSAWRALTRTACWSALPAVRSGKIDTLPAGPLSEYTAFTHELLLDEALKLWRDRA